MYDDSAAGTKPVLEPAATPPPRNPARQPRATPTRILKTGKQLSYDLSAFSWNTS